MVNDSERPPPPGGPVRDVPVDWEALEDAFENNAPEVHSYLHLTTGEVLRVVDGVADPQMHVRIASDGNYLRIDPVSSREQYRWMERFIPMVDDTELRGKLAQAIDGKGAFRRFKDVLMSYGPDRERWFTFRSERLRTFMEAWLVAHALNAIPRPNWPAEAAPGDAPPEATEGGEAPPVDEAAAPAAAAEGREPPREAPRRARNPELLRKHVRELTEALGPRDLETLAAFGDFLKARRIARSYAHHQEAQDAHEAHDESQPETSPLPPSAEPADPVENGEGGRTPDDLGARPADEPR
jgi:hypothetical protein